jgi:hypothetical protein
VSSFVKQARKSQLEATLARVRREIDREHRDYQRREQPPR